MQYATTSAFGSMVAAGHPVNALALLLVALLATRRAWQFAPGSAAEP